MIYEYCCDLSPPQHRYDAIVEWWSKLAEDNPDLVKYEESIGKSLEGRDQPAVHITASMEPDVKKIYFQCQIHASMSEVWLFYEQV